MIPEDDDIVTLNVLPYFRWLLANGYTEKAEKILHEIADFNGKPLPADFKLKSHYEPSQKSNELQDGNRKAATGHGIFGFLSLFRYPNLRMKTLIVYYIWFATSFVYYGLTLNSNDYGASLFVSYSIGKGMLFLGGVVESNDNKFYNFNYEIHPNEFHLLKSFNRSFQQWRSRRFVSHSRY